MSVRTVGLILAGCFSLLALSGGSVPVSAGITVPPTITGPAEGSTLSSFGATLTWTNPGGATQYHLQVIPNNNDGPGIDTHVGSIGTQFAIPAPPNWYGLLPDMTYTWRVRDSDASTFVALDDASWSPWATGHFRTPAVTSSSLLPQTPAQAEVVRTLTPTIQWASSSSIFYFEFQLSKDGSFNTDPATASAMVYSALLHGGVTSLRNSYAVPANFPLEDNNTYYWRVRPRVQGDGKPTAWSAVTSFQTKTSAAPALSIAPISFGRTDPNVTTCEILGASQAFVASATFTGVTYALKYAGAGTVSVNWYRNGVSLSERSSLELKAGASCSSGTKGVPNGLPRSGLLFSLPEQPGDYRVEVWHAGQRIQSGSFVVAPAATVLDVGPAFMGTSRVGCALFGVSSAYPSSTKTLIARALWVGTGKVSAILSTGNTPVMGVTYELKDFSGCVTAEFTPTAGFSPGTWKVAYYLEGQELQATTFTIQ